MRQHMLLHTLQHKRYKCIPGCCGCHQAIVAAHHASCSPNEPPWMQYSRCRCTCVCSGILECCRQRWQTEQCKDCMRPHTSYDITLNQSTVQPISQRSRGSPTCALELQQMHAQSRLWGHINKLPNSGAAQLLRHVSPCLNDVSPYVATAVVHLCT